MSVERSTGPALVAIVALLAPVPGGAADLLQTYRQAVAEDAEFAAARADYRAAREAKPQARAAVLPQLTLSASREEVEQTDNTDGSTSDFPRTNAQLTATQTLFDWNQFAGLDRADARVAQAEADLAAAQQDLVVRVADAYFDVLSAADSLRFATAEKEAIERQLEQAQQRFDVGLIPVTDVKEAQASFDLALSREIAAENQLENAREALRTITGMPTARLSPLGEELPLDRPEPAAPSAWVDTALEQNPSFLSARSAAEVARHNIRQARSGRYPRVDLVANYSQQETRFAGNIASDTEEQSIGIQLNWDFYSGGATGSRTDEARAGFEAAQSRVVQARRGAEQSTRDAYRGLEASISQVNALDQAVESNQAAVEATRAGFRVGTRTAVDVLNALRDLYAAQRDLADARYNYIVNRLRLQQAAGTLTIEDVRLVNSWLTEPNG